MYECNKAESSYVGWANYTFRLIFIEIFSNSLLTPKYNPAYMHTYVQY